jgi:hypothetical protein
MIFYDVKVLKEIANPAGRERNHEIRIKKTPLWEGVLMRD